MKCSQCNSKFEAKRSTAKYCSAQCRVAASRVTVAVGSLSVTDTNPKEVSVTDRMVGVKEGYKLAASVIQREYEQEVLRRARVTVTGECEKIDKVMDCLACQRRDKQLIADNQKPLGCKCQWYWTPNKQIWEHVESYHKSVCV